MHSGEANLAQRFKFKGMQGNVPLAFAPYSAGRGWRHRAKINTQEAVSDAKPKQHTPTRS